MKGNHTYTGSILKDKRLEHRFDEIVSVCTNHLSQTIPDASHSWSFTKGMYRFMGNSIIEPEALVNYHVASQMSGELSSHKRVIQICDSTELDYTNKRCSAELGPLSYPHQRGLHLYNSMLVNELGTPMGLFMQTYATRLDATFAQSRERSQKLPLEEKESYNWVLHLEKGQQLLDNHKDLEVVYVADRAADFMELFFKRTSDRMHFVVRSRHNRAISGSPVRLSTTINSWIVQGQYETAITDAKTNRKRMVKLEVRFGRVDVELHKANPFRRNLGAIALNIVDVRALEDSETIHWRLLTTLPIESMQDAKQVIQYYLWRWIIERFHFILKSGGAGVEQLQLTTAHRIKNAITIFSIAAMDVLKMKYLAENEPDTPIYSLGIPKEEHRVLYTFLHQTGVTKIEYDPNVEPTIREYCIALGQLGGFFKSKRQPIPGLKILARAREKLDFLLIAYFNMSKNSS